MKNREGNKERLPSGRATVDAGRALSRAMRSLQYRDPLWHRIRVLLVSIFDAFSCAALLLQMSEQGIPTLGDIPSRLFSATIMEEFWFWPFAIAAGSAVAFGGIMGGIFSNRASLALYSYFSVVSTTYRILIIFEQSKDDNAQSADQRTLLVDVLVTSACVLISLAAYSESTGLELVLTENSTAQRCDSSSSSVDLQEFSNDISYAVDDSQLATHACRAEGHTDARRAWRTTRRRARPSPCTSGCSAAEMPLEGERPLYEPDTPERRDPFPGRPP